MRPGTLQFRLKQGRDLETAVKTPVRANHKIVYQGREYTSLQTLAKENSIHYSTLYARLIKGWDLEKALKIPVRVKNRTVVYQGGKYKSLLALAKEQGMNLALIHISVSR